MSWLIIRFFISRNSSFRIFGRSGAFGGRGGGSQVLSLGAAQGGFVELALPEPGHYPFVTHAMADAEKGAHGVLKVR